MSNKISVVIPCYNSKDTIKRAVDSVFFQTTRPLEIILVDDKSNLENIKYLKDLQSKYPTEWIKVILCEVNKGAAAARNIGWEQAAGEYIAFLDSDDAWHNQKIELQIKLLKKNKTVKILGHESSIYKTKLNENQCLKNLRIYQLNKYFLLLSNPMALRTIIIRKDFHIKFNDSKRYMEDYDWILRIAFDNIKIYKSEGKLSFTFKKNWGESGLSSHIFNMEINELKIYCELYKFKKINLIILILILIYSLIKFIRRLVVSKINI